MRKSQLMFATLAALAVAFACGKKKEAAKDDTKAATAAPSTPAAETGTIAVTGDAFDASINTALTDVEAVKDNDVPPAMAGDIAVDAANLALTTAPGSLFESQPLAIKTYLAYNKATLDRSAKVLRHYAPFVRRLLEKGKLRGKIDLEAKDQDDSKLKAVIAKVEDAEHYELLLVTDLGPWTHLRVDGKNYKFSVAADNGPNPAKHPKGTILYSNLEYQDSANWVNRSGRYLKGCDIKDERVGPNVMSLVMRMDHSIWKGKAMLFFRHELGVKGACGADRDKLAIYSDFVGDTKGTTLGLYFLPATIGSFADQEAYAASKACSTITGLCTIMGKALGAIPDNYPNPACVRGSDITYTGACTGGDTSVTNATYGPDTDWVLPQALEALTATLPEVAAE